MCLILFAYKVLPEYPLILAANRDEFYSRPTRKMQFWKKQPQILAGKDLEQGGTWFGVSTQGRFAALTNFRDPSTLKSGAPSRGEVIIDFLNSQASCETYFKQFQKKAAVYNGFNLIFGDHDGLFWFSNLVGKIERISPGIHGLSNRHLDTNWPKVEKGKKNLEKVIGKPFKQEHLFSVLSDNTFPDDALLPDTGVGLETERMLAPLFIQSPGYGTRSSTLMLVTAKGDIKVAERTYTSGNLKQATDHCFNIPS